MQSIEFGPDGIRGVDGEWPWIQPIIMRMGQSLAKFSRRRKEEPS